MKRITISLLALSFLMLNVAQAQDGDKDFKKGIRAGWQTANIFDNGKIIEDAENLNSFFVGFFTVKKNIPILHFGSGLEYCQNGAHTAAPKVTEQTIHTLRVTLNLRIEICPT